MPFKKGDIPWNKGKEHLSVKGSKSPVHRPEVREKLFGENHWNFKGGKPKCLDCGKRLTNYKNKRCRQHHVMWHKGKNHCSFGKTGKIAWNKDKKFPQYSGKNSPHWKGGISYTKNWYTYIYMPEHPNSIKGGRLSAHRYCAEAYLGRFLESEEVIHHMNEIKSDNRPENLYLFPNNKLHSAYHSLLKAGLIEPITESNLL